MKKEYFMMLLSVAALFSCTKDIIPPVNTGNKVVIEILSTQSVQSDSATINCDIELDGGESITERGVCWSTGSSPTISDSVYNAGTGRGLFTVRIGNLTPATRYRVRAYCKNLHGLYYSATTSIVTTAGVPVLNTESVNSITYTTAMSGGNIVSSSGASISVKGVCWSTSSNPTIANSRTSNGSGNSSFVSTLTGLTHNTTYYVRAYATNSAGTGYGNQFVFRTLQLQVPAVTTSAVTSITRTTAVSGGNVTVDGGSSVVQRGVCWNTTGTPTINNSRTTNGSGIGSFTSSISGLTRNTTYYLRAYARNAVGVSYGVQISFRTQN